GEAPAGRARLLPSLPNRPCFRVARQEPHVLDENETVGPSNPSVALAEPPFNREQSGEDQEKRPVVPDLVLGWADKLGNRGGVEALEVAGQLFGGERLTLRQRGDLACECEVCRRVLKLAIVLVDEEPAGVTADLLAVALGNHSHSVVSG